MKTCVHCGAPSYGLDYCDPCNTDSCLRLDKNGETYCYRAGEPVTDPAMWIEGYDRYMARYMDENGDVRPELYVEYDEDVATFGAEAIEILRELAERKGQ